MKRNRLISKFVLGILILGFLVFSLANSDCIIKSVISNNIEEVYSFDVDITYQSLTASIPIRNPIVQNVFQHNFTNSPFYDQSMYDFHKLNQSHSVATGEGITVVVIDSPVDYRHAIFRQENFDSLPKENCYRVPWDNIEKEIGEIYQLSTPYVGNFTELFEDKFDESYFPSGELPHGTVVASMVKQVAPKSNIISMGVEVTASDDAVLAHAQTLEWIDLNFDDIKPDIITFSYFVNYTQIDAGYISRFQGAVSELISKDVLFTMAVGNYYVDLHDLQLYGAMGWREAVIGVGRCFDEETQTGILEGEGGECGFNGDLSDTMRLELMASGYNLEAAIPMEEENTFNMVTTEGTSLSTPIVAGAVALLKEHTGETLPAELEKMLHKYTIPAKYYIPLASESYLKTYYGNGSMNIAGALGIGDWDEDGLTDEEELSETYPTDPWDPDYDNDGLLDGDEYLYGTNPLTSDFDSDGILDGEEVIPGEDGFITNPLEHDTDGDYLWDNWEINHQFDPTNNDTNGDGTWDGYEDPDNDGLANHEEALYGTNHTNADTDGDNLLDGYEIQFCATNPLLIDTDGDGLFDDWEWVYGLDPTTPNANSDPDSDGLTNYQEYLAGTNPVVADTDSDGMPDGWELSNNFNPLVNDANQDPDLDGATNLEEYSHNTDPYDDDTDNDGMEDGWEIDYSLNPLVDDGMGDADGDGLYNIDEFVNNCDPTDTDTDNDGLNDKQEILNQCDPNDTDTDNDGWTDGFEVYTSGTEPDDADTDNDGLTDKIEYNYWVNTRGRTSSQAYAYIKDADVDNDNLNDGAELTVGTDPLDNDSDNDGLYDGSEGLYYDTDPTDYDSDNDGYNDGEEVAAGTDPNDPNDHPGSGGGGGFGW
ncbi:MAG: S8/S53 family peptidase [Asgard group archaeon]|nr:S8/S53 family peptidase [Asgard group archaeon]